MKNSTITKAIIIGLVTFAFCIVAAAQTPDVARKTTAITYPPDDTVNIEFRGTTRFPRMKGNATVVRKGRSGTEINLSVENMPRLFDLGPGYATYVLWAISPTGQTDNLGEIKRSGFGFVSSKIRVTTPLQTFSLIITAEPHFLVTRPSQMIMMENLYPTTTTGKRIPTSPAITYFGNSSDYFRDPRTPEIAEVDYRKTPPAILEAKQAVALAKFAGAERDAADELADAERLFQNAQNSWEAGRDSDTVDIAARNSIAAAFKAENLAIERKAAREKRNEKTRTDAEIRAAENKYANAQDQINDLKNELARETRNRELAERDAMNFSNQIKDLKTENGQLREDLGRTRADLEAANTKLANAETERKAMQDQNAKDLNAAKIRADEPALINSLKTFGTVAKTDRGITLTLPESWWGGPRSSALMPQAEGKLTSLAEILASNPGYRISVESHTDNSGVPDQIQGVTDKRSYMVADKFAAMGIDQGRIAYKGFGATLPVAPNTTAVNRAKNRRMQVILSLNQP